MNRLLLSVGLLASLGLPSAAPAAQAPYRVFVAPLAANQEGGPTRHEYVMLFERRDECAGVVPTSREDRADFTVWFEHDGLVHSLLLWDPHGDLVSERGGVSSRGTISSRTCATPFGST